jgi:hypothetical protein
MKKNVSDTQQGAFFFIPEILFDHKEADGAGIAGAGLEGRLSRLPVRSRLNRYKIFIEERTGLTSAALHGAGKQGSDAARGPVTFVLLLGANPMYQPPACMIKSGGKISGM